MQPPEFLYKKAVPKTFGIFTEKHLYWSLFLVMLKAFGIVASFNLTGSLKILFFFR